MKQKNLVFILYDGITNSVFEGQVLQPLLEKKQKNASLSIHIVSYEHNKPSDTIIARLSLVGITLHILKKKLFSTYPFIMGTIFSHSLKKLLSQFSQYELIARGPLAGYVCLHAITKNKCKKLTIQARGLLAQEHRYIHQDERNYIFRLLYWLRTWQLERLEKRVYTLSTRHNMCCIEAVSPALKHYLIKTYNTDPKKISIAQRDIPKTIPAQQIQNWKKSFRYQLNIPHNAYVYCYNGSAKPWQCPELVVDFFAQQFKKNKQSFLLILTQDKKIFLTLLKQKAVPKNTYKVISVSHKNIYQYLAAANAGILFRKKHIINWVSRPTKILEYNAVGLTLIHNNAVAYAQK